MPPKQSEVVVGMVLEVLDESRNGLIEEKELKEAMKKVAGESNLNIEEKALDDIIKAIYTNDDGIKANQLSRKSIRHLLEELPEIA